VESIPSHASISRFLLLFNIVSGTNP